MMRPVVLVTAIGTAASTTIISRLRESDYYIIGGDIYPKNQVASSKDVDEFYVFPPAIRELEYYIEFAVDFCRKHKVSYYFATIDEEIENLSKHRSRFEEIGVKLCIPNHELIMTCHYKDRFSDWIDINLPEIGTKRYRSFSEVDDYPVFIKPVEGRSSIGCRIVEDKNGAEKLLAEGLNEENYLIQEFLDCEIIAVDLIRDAETGHKMSIQRIEHLRNASGCGIAVEITDYPKLRSICDELMDKLDLNGVVNAEFFHKTDAGSDTFKIIEINPRFGAGTSFSCAAGCDIVTAAIRIADGKEYDPGCPAIGAHLAKRFETYRLD